MLEHCDFLCFLGVQGLATQWHYIIDLVQPKKRDLLHQGQDIFQGRHVIFPISGSKPVARSDIKRRQNTVIHLIPIWCRHFSGFRSEGGLLAEPREGVIRSRVVHGSLFLDPTRRNLDPTQIKKLELMYE